MWSGRKTGGLGRALLAALTFHVNVLEARRGYLPGNWDILWSLSVEEMFYLFPLACRFLSRGKLFVVTLFVFVVLGPFARTVLTYGNPVWREYSYLGGMDAIALGCLTALLLAKRPLAAPVLRVAGFAGATLMILVLCFTLCSLHGGGLDRTGLDMTVLAVGTCMVIAAAAESQWRSPLIFAPLRLLGQRSYEVYLTHMFVVFGLFSIFLGTGKPLRGVPILFVAVIAASGVVGELVARYYSEPMNRWLRERFGDGPRRMGSAALDSKAEPLVELHPAKADSR